MGHLGRFINNKTKTIIPRPQPTLIESVSGAGALRLGISAGPKVMPHAGTAGACCAWIHILQGNPLGWITVVSSSEVLGKSVSHHTVKSRSCACGSGSRQLWLAAPHLEKHWYTAGGSRRTAGGEMWCESLHPNPSFYLHSDRGLGTAQGHSSWWAVRLRAGTGTLLRPSSLPFPCIFLCAPLHGLSSLLKVTHMTLLSARWLVTNSVT